MKKSMLLIAALSLSLGGFAQKNGKKGNTENPTPNTNTQAPPPPPSKDKSSQMFNNITTASQNLLKTSDKGPFFKIREDFKKLEEEMKISLDSILELAFPSDVDNFVSMVGMNGRNMKMPSGPNAPNMPNGPSNMPGGLGGSQGGGTSMMGPGPMMGPGAMVGMGGTIFQKMYNDNSLNRNAGPDQKTKPRGSIRVNISENQMEISRYKQMLDKVSTFPADQLSTEVVDLKNGQKCVIVTYKNTQRIELVIIKNTYMVRVEGNNLPDDSALKKLAEKINFQAIYSALGN